MRTPKRLHTIAVFGFHFSPHHCGKTCQSSKRCIFVRSARTLYLSPEDCKGISLVSEDFPLYTQPVHGGMSHQAPPKPTEVPFSPLEENIERLKEWLFQHLSSTTFNTTLPVMAGLPHHIQIVLVLPHTPVTSL